MYIPPDGRVSYYDHGSAATTTTTGGGGGSKKYPDGGGRRVVITRSVFSDNDVTFDGDGSVAGLVTSAYSLTISDCLFERNAARSMVFVYNDDAMVYDTVFAENAAEVSTVIMSSPGGGKGGHDESAATTTTTAATAGPIIEPTHIVERSCFLGSKVGVSNVLATSTERVAFGQRDNHVSGTSFTWASTCEGAAAEKFGDDCLEGGDCDGTCVTFDGGECLASRVRSGGIDRHSNAAAGGGRGGGGHVGGGWGALLGAVVLLFDVWQSY